MLTYLFQVTFCLASLLLLTASCSTSWHILVPSTRRWCHLTVIIEISPVGIQPYSYIQSTKNVWIKNTTLLFYVITKHITFFPFVFFRKKKMGKTETSQDYLSVYTSFIKTANCRKDSAAYIIFLHSCSLSMVYQKKLDFSMTCKYCSWNSLSKSE